MASGGSTTFSLNIKTNADLKAIEKLKNSLNEVRDIASKSGNAFSASDLNAIAAAANDLERAFNKGFDPSLGTVNLKTFNKSLLDSGTNLQQVQQNLSMTGEAGQKAFFNTTAQILQMNSTVKESHSFIEKLSKTFLNSVRYQAMNKAIQTISGSISEAYGYIKHLDSSLNDIQIVTEKNAEAMERFAVQANSAAKALGSGTTDYTSASLIYYQQGLSDEEVLERTNTTIKMANVLGESASKVSDYMTAIWNNFDDGSESLEYYGDVITSLGAHTASSADEIAEGLSKFASVASTVGLSYEYATSALATVVAKTRQSADTVGTAFKTLFARMQGLQLGETLDDGTTLTKYSKALEAVGVSIKDQNGNLKAMDTLLDEMGSKWQTLAKDEQVALAQTVAGTRQYTQLVALMESWDDVKENITVAADSYGTLEKKQDIYMEKTEAHIQVMKTQFEDLYDSLLDTKSINSVVDAITLLAKGMTTFVDGVGGAGPVMLALGSIGVKSFSNQIGESLAKVVTNTFRAEEQAKSYAESLKEIEKLFPKEAEYFNNGETSEATKQSVDQMVGFYQAMQQYTGAMSQGELNEFNALMAESANLSADQAKLETMEKVWENLNTQTSLFTKQLTGSNSTEALEKLNNEINQMGASIAEAAEWANTLPESFDGLTKADLNSIIDTTTFKINLNNISKNFVAAGGSVKQFETILKAAGVSSSQLKNNITFDQETGAIKRFSNVSRESYEKIINVMRQWGIEIEAGQGKINNFAETVANEAERIRKAQEDMLKTQILKDMISGITKLAGSLGQVASIWRTVANLPKIWDDEDVSTAEKVLQSFTAFSFVIPQIITFISGAASAFKQFNSIMEGFNILKTVTIELDGGLAIEEAYQLAIQKALNKAKEIGNVITKEELLLKSAEEIQQITGNALDAKDLALIKGKTKAQAAYNVVLAARLVLEKLINPTTLIAVAAIAALTAGVWLCINARDAEINSIKALEEENEKLKESYEDLKTNANDLKSAFSDYQSAYDGIAKLEQGTEDWSNSIADANEKALELINTYKDLEWTRDENGAIQITNYDKVIKSKEINIARAKAEVNGSTAIINKTKFDYDLIKNNPLEGLMANTSIVDTKERKAELTKDIVSKYSDGKIDDSELEELKNDFFDLQTINDTNLAIDNLIKDINSNENIQLSLQKVFKNYESLNKENQLLQEEAAKGLIQAEESFNDFIETPVLQMELVNVSAQHVAEEENGLAFSKEEISGKADLILSENSEHFSEDDFNEYLKQIGVYDKAENINAENNSYQIRDDNGKLKTVNAGLTDISKVLAKKELQDEAIKKQTDTQKTAGLDYLEKINSIEGLENFKGLSETLQSFYDGTGNLDLLQLSSPEQLKALQSYNWTKIFGDNYNFEDIAKAIDEAINNYEFNWDSIINSARASVENIKSAFSTLGEDKELSDEQLSYLEELEQKYTELGEIKNRSSERYLELLEAIQQKEENNKITAMKNALADKQKKAEETQNKEKSNFSTTVYDMNGHVIKEKTQEEVNAELNLSNSKAFTENLKQITDQKYEIEIAITDDVLTDADNVIDKIGNITSAIESIGEGYQVAADKADALFEVFPELALNAEVTENGIIQLNNEATKIILDNYADIIDEDKNVTSAKIKSRIEELKADMVSAQNKLDILNDETTSEEEANNIMLEMEREKASDEVDLSKTVAEDGITNNGNMMKNVINNWEAAEDAALAYAKTAKDALTDPLNAVKHMSNEAGRIITDVTTANNTGNIVSNAEDVHSEYLSRLEQSKAALENRIQSDTDQIADLTKALANINSQIENAKKSGGSSSGGGSSRSNKELKDLDDLYDRYYILKKAINDVEDALSDLDKYKSHLSGKQLIDSLKNENNLLKEQETRYNNLYAEQKKHQAELQSSLGAAGMTFNADGNISNYGASVSAAVAAYNNAVSAYNSGGLSEESFAAAESAYNAFKSQLSIYQSLLTDMQDTENKLDDIYYKNIENNKTIWETEIQIKVDWNNLETEWNEFLHDINKDVTLHFNNNIEDIKLNVDNEAFLKDNLSTYMASAQKAGEEIAKFAADPNYQSDMFVSISEAQVSLTDINSKIQECATSLKENFVAAWEKYLAEIDQASEKLDGIIDKYEMANTELSHTSQMYTLMYGKASLDVQEQIAQKQTELNGSKMLTLKGEVELYEKQYQEIVKNNGAESEDAVKLYNLKTAKQKEYWESEEEYAKSVNEEYIAGINKAYDEFSRKMSGGLSLDEVDEEWRHMQETNEGVYDDNQALTQRTKLRLKSEALIAKTSTKNQAKIKKYTDEINKGLEEREELTEYDVTLAEKKLKLMEAQMALEDAKDNKTKMRMRRDANGNWTYNYVADESDINSKKQDVADATSDLYDTAKNENVKRMQDLYNLYKEFYNSSLKLETDLKNGLITQEDYNTQKAKLKEQFDSDLAILKQRLQITEEDLSAAALVTVLNNIELEKTAQQNLTEEQKRMFDAAREAGVTAYEAISGSANEEFGKISVYLREQVDKQLPEMQTSAKKIVDALRLDPSNPNSFNALFSNLSKSTEDLAKTWSENMAKCDSWSQISVGNIIGGFTGINTTIQATEAEADKLLNPDTGLAKGLNDASTAVQSLKKAWEDMISPIQSAIDKIKEWLQLQGQTKTFDAQEDPSGGQSTGDGGGYGGQSTGDDGGYEEEDQKVTQNEEPSKKWYTTRNGNPDKGPFQTKEAAENAFDKVDKKEYKLTGYTLSADKKSKIPYDSGWSNSKPSIPGIIDANTETRTVKVPDPKYTWGTTQFDTGGYTGDWNGGDGRIAMLHSKELVLNAKDTENMLEMVSAVRSITANVSTSISSVLQNKLADYAASANPAYSVRQADTSGVTNNTYNITAEFPNTNNVDEIREAILSLPRLASQYKQSYNRQR